MAGKKRTGIQHKVYSFTAPLTMDVTEQAKRAGFTGNRSAYIVHLLRQDAARLNKLAEVTK